MLYIKSVQIAAGAQGLAQHTSSKRSACKKDTVSSSRTMPGWHSASKDSTDCSTVDSIHPLPRLRAGVTRETDKYHANCWQHCLNSLRLMRQTHTWQNLLTCKLGSMLSAGLDSTAGGAEPQHSCSCLGLSGVTGTEPQYVRQTDQASGSAALQCSVLLSAHRP